MRLSTSPSFLLNHISLGRYDPSHLRRRALPLTDYSELLIPGLRLWLSLGCSAEERAVPQPVDIDIKIRFTHDLPGCYSDELAGVVCYHTLTEKIIQAIQHQSFHIIEFLAVCIFSIVEKQISSFDANVEITVTKPHCPVPNVQKGVSFKYCRRVSKKSL